METQNDQSVDSVFGQTPAFSLADPRVNPAVIQYLSSVRQEALRTDTIKTTRVKRHTADIYDDDEVVVKRSRARKDLSAQVEYFDAHLSEYIDWFERVKRIVLDNGTLYQSHTEESLNLLLNYLRQYLGGKSEGDAQASHLLTILKDLPSVEEDDNYELDEKWAESVVKKLRTRNINGVDDIKAIIDIAKTPKPMGFKQWYQYVQRTEPSQSVFSTMIDGKNIWVLVQYMTQEWVKSINKCKKPAQAARFGHWLLYILFNIPDRLTAEYTSNLRNLGKRCRRAFMETHERSETGQNACKSQLLKDAFPRELKELNVRSPPAQVDIIQLALSVIASIYGQRDLIDWNITDDQL